MTPDDVLDDLLREARRFYALDVNTLLRVEMLVDHYRKARP